MFRYFDNVLELIDRPFLTMLDEVQTLPDKAEWRSRFSRDLCKSRASDPYQAALNRI